MSHLGDPFGLDNRTKIIRVVETADREVIEGYGVHYWYTIAKNLEKNSAILIAESDESLRVRIERKATDAGLRAVIRYALNELRKTDPKNPLLDKKVRDRIFKEFEKEEMDKILNNRKLKPWSPLELPEEVHSSE